MLSGGMLDASNRTQHTSQELRRYSGNQPSGFVTLCLSPQPLQTADGYQSAHAQE